jgi:vitamin B12 transporter
MKIKHSKPGDRFFFRKFTRKKYAAFNSMHRVVHISALAAAYSLIVSTTKVSAQKDTLSTPEIINLDEVEIIGQKGPSQFEELPRLVTVILSKDIECAPAHTIPDLLRYIANVDVRQRGKDGIQSDISIRGGSFDQNLILLNGINISDPQTGHLSLFLPVESEAIKRIEILNGPAARVHGANAFSGAINFVTYPDKINTFDVTAEAGYFGYFSSSATVNLVTGNVKSLLHYNNGFSSGYARNTDFRRNSVFYQGIVTNNEGQFDIQFGYSDRAYGANGFYTPRYPDQFEENRLTFTSFGYKTGNFVKLHPQFYWRRLRDRFELFREGINWYRIEDSITISNNIQNTTFDTVSWYSSHNHHISDVYGAQLTTGIKTFIGESTLGLHLRSENILSTNIGYDKGIVAPVRGYRGAFYNKSDNRNNFDIYLEQTIDLKTLYISGGLLLNWNSYLPDEVNLFPGIDFRYFLAEPLSVYGSYNHTLALPTFTDLTYEDPSNQGNSTLKPYSQNSLEGGVRYLIHSAEATLAVFYNFGKGIIDWIWFSDELKFKPVNIKSFNGRGIEFTGYYNVDRNSLARYFLRSFRASYTYIDMHKNTPGNILKYFNVRQQASAMLQHEFIKNFVVSENISYLEREGSYITYDFNNNSYVSNPFRPYWLVDMRISYTWKSVGLYLEATNFFNVEYVDAGSIYQPGRWLSAGLKYKISGF